MENTFNGGSRRGANIVIILAAILLVVAGVGGVIYVQNNNNEPESKPDTPAQTQLSADEATELFLKGIGFAEAGNYEKAVKQLEPLLGLETDGVDQVYLHVALGDSYVALTRYDEAKLVLENIANLTDDQESLDYARQVLESISETQKGPSNEDETEKGPEFNGPKDEE